MGRQGWMGLPALEPCVCPLGGAQGCPGGVHLCGRGPNAVSRLFFPSPRSHSAFQLHLPLSGPLGLGETEGRRGGVLSPPLGPGWRRTFTFTAFLTSLCSSELCV